MRLYEEYACEVHGINSVMKGLAIGGLNIHHGLIVLAIKKELNANNMFQRLRNHSVQIVDFATTVEILVAYTVDRKHFIKKSGFGSG